MQQTTIINMFLSNSKMREGAHEK
uniref:Uncharacterized protein n=1 Tax=Rhizophora mucronata TaxID=61149 RepID=A0A2P2IX07_RHIMU